jgi:hypothetical protein
MHENGKIRPVKTSKNGGGIKESTGTGEFN